jgi:hypothetical protein
MTGCGGGGALGAHLQVALLSVQSGCRWNGMECLVIELGSSPYPLYNEIGQVHDNLGVLVYGLRAPESRRALQRC